MYLSIVDIVQNTEKVYDGDLQYYFKIIFSAPNVNAPYHNFRHMMHITWSAYDAIKYYGDFDKRDARALLIAAMFHDYGHKGTAGNDFENIANAKESVRNHIMEKDKNLLPSIEELISATEFPYTTIGIARGVRILRDADMSPSFDNVWIQEVLFGLSKESGKDPTSFLKEELTFISNITFNTDWAIKKFSLKKEERIAEIEKLLRMLG